MSLSTGTMKTILQVLNVVMLIGSLILIIFGIWFCAAPDSLRNYFSIENEDDAIIFNNAMSLVGGVFILFGLIFGLVYTFGIYYVAKEHPTKVRTFGIANLIIAFMVIISCIYDKKSASMISDGLLMGAIVYFSFELSGRFLEKENQRNNRNNNLAPVYKV